MVWGDGKYKEPPALQLAALFLHATVEPVGNSDRLDENGILRPQKFIMTVSQPRLCHLGGLHAARNNRMAADNLIFG